MSQASVLVTCGVGCAPPLTAKAAFRRSGPEVRAFLAHLPPAFVLATIRVTWFG